MLAGLCDLVKPRGIARVYDSVMCSMLASAILLGLMSQASAQNPVGFTPLVVTNTLSGWIVEHPGEEHARVERDALIIDHRAGWVRTDRKKFGNFRLRFQVRGTPGTERPLVGVFGYWSDAADRGPSSTFRGSAFAIPLFGELPDPKDVGAMNLRAFQSGLAAVQSALRGSDTWQEFDVTRSGTSIVMLLNGVEVVQARGPMTMDGWIGFMTDGGTISIRGIEIAELAGPPTLPAGVFQPGNGVALPRRLKEVKPDYTREAMKARIEGVVVVEGIVETDGKLDQIQVIRSLDSQYGLDDQAVKAASQWRFSPGTKDGQPVRVAITIELKFTLRK
jgi:TonB family protein